MKFKTAERLEVVFKEGVSAPKSKSANVTQCYQSERTIKTELEAYKKIGKEIIDNIPIGGITVRRKLGGMDDFNNIKTYIKILDPRGFEVEISESSFESILNSNNIGKDGVLEGEYVYGWEGEDLTLISTKYKYYTRLQEYASGVFRKTYVTEDGIIEGVVYKDESGKLYTYMGEETCYESDYKEHHHFKTLCEHNKEVGERHVFWTEGEFINLKSIPKDFKDTGEAYDEEEYERLTEELDCSGMTSPIDGEDDGYYIDYTLEEFSKALSKVSLNDWSGYFCDKDKDMYKVRRTEVGYSLHKRAGKGEERLTEKQKGLTLKEIFHKIEPKHFQIFLMNGKKYKILF
jgi:hypothetical protein